MRQAYHYVFACAILLHPHSNCFYFQMTGGKGCRHVASVTELWEASSRAWAVVWAPPLPAPLGAWRAEQEPRLLRDVPWPF